MLLEVTPDSDSGPASEAVASSTGVTTEAWLHSRWEKDTRYYELLVQQDLWGQWLLTRVWGRRGSAMGQIRHELCESYAAGLTKYAEAENKREKRGYHSIVEIRT